MLIDCAEVSVSPVWDEPREEDRLLVFGSGGVLMPDTLGAPALAPFAALAPLLPAGARWLHMATAAGTRAYCPDPTLDMPPVEAPAGFRYGSAREFQRMAQPDASLLTACNHLWQWYAGNRYCGLCGQPLAPSRGERALECAACHNQIFPMIAPAVIVAITKNDKLLLAQNVRYATRHHTLVAGYVEVGETLEHAVRREVMEEVGLRLGELRYLGDQPWGLSGSMMFAFHAECVGDDPIRLQPEELSGAAWYAREALPMDIGKGSIAYALIERFRDGRL